MYAPYQDDSASVDNALRDQARFATSTTPVPLPPQPAPAQHLAAILPHAVSATIPSDLPPGPRFGRPVAPGTPPQDSVCHQPPQTNRTLEAYDRWASTRLTTKRSCKRRTSSPGSPRGAVGPNEGSPAPHAAAMWWLSRTLQQCPATLEAVSGFLRSWAAADTAPCPLPALTRLVSRVSRAGDCRKALLVFESLPALSLAPDTHIANAAIAACGRGGDWERAMYIFHDMDRLNLTRDAITYSSAIFALSGSKDCRRCVQLFLRMCEQALPRDFFVWHSLLTAFGKAGKWRLAERVFVSVYHSHRLLRSLVDLSGTATSTLSAEDAELLALLKPHLGDKATGLTPCSSGSPGAFTTSTEHRSSPTPHNLDPAPNAVSKQSSEATLTDTVQRLMQLQLSAAPRASQEPARCRGGHLFLHASEQRTPSPLSDATPRRSGERNVLNHQQALESFASNESDAIGHVQASSAPDDTILRASCNALLLAYSSANPAQCERCMKLVLNMLGVGGVASPDSVSLNAVLGAYTSAGKPEEALHMYDHLVGMGIKPNAATFGALISCATDAGMTGEVQSLVSDLQSRRIAPSTACVNAQMRALIQQKQWSAAVVCYEALLRASSPAAPDTETMAIVMAELLAQGQPQGAIDVHNKLTSLNVSKSCRTTKLLLQAHRELNQLREAHSALVAAAWASPRSLDADGLLIFQKQLAEAIIRAPEHCSAVVGLQQSALDACWKVSVEVTAECVELACATCAVPQATEQAQRLQADAVVDILLNTAERGVRLGRASIAHVLRACCSKGQRALPARILSECVPALSQQPVPSAGHGAVLLALCALHGNAGVLRAVLGLFSTAPPAAAVPLPHVASRDIDVASSSDGAAAALAGALCLAVSGLWEASFRGIALDILLCVPTV